MDLGRRRRLDANEGSDAAIPAFQASHKISTFSRPDFETEMDATKINILTMSENFAGRDKYFS